VFTFELVYKRSFVVVCMLMLFLLVITGFGIHSVIGKPRDYRPIADAGGAYSGTEGDAISFDGSGSTDFDGSVVSWLWDFGDGETLSGETVTHMYSQEGDYVIVLTVSDDKDNTDTDTTSVTVEDVDPLADFSVSSTSGFTPLSVTFNDLSESYDGVLSWFWDFGDGQTSTEQNPTNVYTEGVYTISLTIAEEDGDVDTTTKQDIIKVEIPTNIPPVADFNIQVSDGALINEIILVIDQSSDIDGTIVFWFWDFGDAVTSTLQNPMHQYQDMGTYMVSLTVEDDDGATSIVAKYVVVREGNPPITNNDYDGLWHNIDFSINLSAIDDYSGVADTYYKINDGPINSVSVVGQPYMTVDGSNNSIEYWSVDILGNEEAHHRIMDIKLDKTFPTADAGPDITINEDTIFSLSGKSYDNIQIVNYTWVLFDDDLKTLSGANPQYIFHTPGEYNVTLMVADAAQNSASDSCTISVVDVTDPVADAGDDIFIYEGKSAAFDGLNSADNVGVIGYVWNFVDVFSQTLTGVDPTYAFSSAGVYEVTLTVSDEQGNFATDVVLVTVIDTTWPVADAGVDQVVVEGTLVYFDGSASSDNVGIASYVWTLIDGEAQSMEGVRTEYYFETPGVYLVTLKVTDVDGNISNDLLSVTVLARTEFELESQNHETIVVNEDSDIEFLPDYLEEDDDGDGLSDEGEFSHELDSEAVFDSNGDRAGNVEQYEESASPEGFDFFGCSLADLLMIPFFAFVVCYILFYKRFFNWVSERGEK